MPNVNDMVIYQASALLASIVSQAQGRTVLAPTNLGEFVSVATTAVKTGVEPIMKALTQMWGRTVFAVRPYQEKFASLYMDMDRWANVTRKVSFADRPVEDDERFKWPCAWDTDQDPASGNGKSADMYKIRKDEILQTQFYGQSTYEDVRTEFLSSLETAFQSPEELMRYNAAAVLNRSNKLAQYRENIGRGLTLNLIGSLYYIANALSPLGDPTRVIHLLTEYNTETGLAGTENALTAQTVLLPDNYPSFVRWVYARIGILTDIMTERSTMFQTTVNGKVINRHTGAQDQRLFILSKYLRQMDSMGKSVTFHDDLLKFGEVESVAYWQDIKTPDQVDLANVISLTGADGAVITSALAAGSTALSNVFGVIFDRDALGCAMTRERSGVTPFNEAGEYWNTFLHVNFRTVQDTTEKSVLLMLD